MSRMLLACESRLNVETFDAEKETGREGFTYVFTMLTIVRQCQSDVRVARFGE